MVDHQKELSPEELSPTAQLIHEFVEQNKGDIPPETVPVIEGIMTKMVGGNLTFKEAIGFSSELIEEMYGYAYTLFQSGKYEEVLPIFTILRFIDGNDERFTFSIAVTHHHMKNYTEAAGNYMLCELLNPDDPLPLYHLSDCFTKLNQPELALNALKMANQVAAKDPKYAQLKEKTELEIEHLKSVVSGSAEKQESSAA